MTCTNWCRSQLVSFAPRYATFGARRYIDSEVRLYALLARPPTPTLVLTTRPINRHTHTQGVSQPCSLNAGSSACPMTVLATTVNRMTLALGIFGAVFYFITWIFVLSTLIIAIVVVVQGKRSNLDEADSDVEMI